jgi:hypothetical protein
MVAVGGGRRAKHDAFPSADAETKREALRMIENV